MSDIAVFLQKYSLISFVQALNFYFFRAKKSVFGKDEAGKQKVHGGCSSGGVQGRCRYFTNDSELQE